MKWFIDLNTRSKLFFAFGLLFVILLAVILVAYNGFTDVQKSQGDMYRLDFQNAVRLIELKADQNRTRADILEMMMIKDREKLRALDEDIKDRAKNITELLAGTAEVLKAEGQTESLRKLEEINAAREAYAKTREQQVKLIYAGRIDDARKLSVDVQEGRYNTIRKLAIELGDDELAQAKNRVAKAETNAKRLQTTFVIAGLLSFFFSILTVFTLNKIIATPLREVTLVAERIASGDLSVSAASDERKDEVGALTRSFAKMTDYLRNVEAVAGKVASGDLTNTIKAQSDKDMLGRALGSMIDNLRSITKEIQESVSVLASSASEILSSTTEVASSVTETATSVNETTTTVEEVKQTAHVASQKAKYVSDASQNVVQISQSGGKAVDEAVEKINRIRQQMEFIAESVVRLSEQSQAIGEIIATVNDLAEQSNLLAVNASIEAAKAGEHGKGFAVVAQEVRSLAEQSKQATAQIRSILNDIQKATSSAVLATEQGSKTVEEGVKQSTQAGEAIKTLAQSIIETAQAATQIAASSQQQLVGMEQVIAAMNNIKLATEQNVAGTKQTEGAAHNIHELGQKLKTLVARYKV
jgi:methyl-accepting chemotaxis protein